MHLQGQGFEAFEDGFRVVGLQKSDRKPKNIKVSALKLRAEDARGGYWGLSATFSRNKSRNRHLHYVNDERC